MTKYKNKTLFSSFKFAISGLLVAIKSHRNFQIGFGLSIIAIITAVLMGFSTIEMALTCLAIGFVLFAELLNTSIEYVVDTYFGDTYSELAKISKDVAAGTVLIAIITAASIGLLIFLPKFYSLLFTTTP